METSYNDWPASPDPAAIGIDPLFTECGVTFPGGIKAGDVSVVFRDLVQQYHATVELLTPGWCWGYDYRANVNNPATLSCHASGTALDLNAPLHPNGVAGTLSPDQTSSARGLVARYEGLVSWGGDFYGTVDEMHWEISGTEQEIAELADRLDSGQGPQQPPGGEDMPLSDEDVTRVADKVLDTLMTELCIPMLEIDPSNGAESRTYVAVTRALQSAQTQSARAAYRTLH